MGTAPKPAVELLERFDRDRRVFRSLDGLETEPRAARTPHEQESIKRTIAAADE
jgi:hypothetical protein